MTAAALLSDLSGAGVTVRIDETGLLKASGDQASLARLLPEIRTHKAELLAILAANDDQPVISHRLWWILHGPDDWRLHSFNTPASLAEVQGWYPGCLIDPVSDTTPAAPAVTLPPDTRRTCRQCRNLARNGRCMAAGRGELPLTASQYEPFQDRPERCIGYLPGADDPDQRTGAERYPGLNQRLWAIARAKR